MRKNTLMLFTVLTLICLLCAALTIGVNAEEAAAEEINDIAVNAADLATDGDVTFTTTSAPTNESEEKTLGVGFWISMGVLGAAIIVGVVFAIVKWDKLKPWLLSYKSELGKVVWMPWTDVKKGSIVVIVCTLVIAAVIGLLDFAFSKGIISLHNIIS